MLKLLDIIHEKLPEDFIKGTLIREGVTNDGLNSFKFNSEDPDNKFAVIEKDFVPTSYLLGSGNVQPNVGLYHEDGTISVSFAITVNNKTSERYGHLESFKRSISGMSGKYDEYKYILNSSPVNPIGNQIVNGVRVLMYEMQIFYQITDKGFFGNSKKYQIRPYLSPLLKDLEELFNPIIPQASEGLIFEEVSGEYARLWKKGTFDNEVLSIPDTYISGISILPVTGIKETEDGNFRNIGIKELYMPDSIDDLEETSVGHFSNNPITKIRFSQNLNMIPREMFDNCSLSGTIGIPSSVKTVSRHAFRQNSIRACIFGDEIETINAAFLDNNPLLRVIAFYSDTPPTIQSFLGNSDIFMGTTETIKNTIYVKQSSVEAYKDSDLVKETSEKPEYNVRTILDIPDIYLKPLSAVIKNASNSLFGPNVIVEKEQLIKKIELGEPISEEIDLAELIEEAEYIDIVRTQSSSNTSSEIIMRQIIGTREAKALKGHTVNGVDLSFYKQDDFLYEDIKKLRAGVAPNNNIYMLRQIEDGDVIYERPVVLETDGLLDNQGDTITIAAVFRVADNLLIQKEIEQFEEEE